MPCTVTSDCSDLFGLVCTRGCTVHLAVLYCMCMWLYCTRPCTVHVAVLYTWMYCIVCLCGCTLHILELYTWLYCTRGCTVHIAVLYTWLYCTHGCTVPLTVVGCSPGPEAPRPLGLQAVGQWPGRSRWKPPTKIEINISRALSLRKIWFSAYKTRACRW